MLLWVRGGVLHAWVRVIEKGLVVHRRRATIGVVIGHGCCRDEDCGGAVWSSELHSSGMKSC